MGNLALLRTTLAGVWRRKRSGILLSALVALSVLVSTVLNGLTLRQETGIEEMVNNTEINCVVTDAQGMHSDDLGMFSSFVELIMGFRHEQGYYLDEYVTDIKAVGTTMLKTPANFELHRILGFRSDRTLSTLEGVTIELFEGYTEDIFQTDAPVCLIPVGVSFSAEKDGSAWIETGIDEDRHVPLRVIGTVRGGKSDVIYSSFYFKWESGKSEAFPVSSCSFIVRDNAKLEETKEEIYRFFVKPALSNTPDGFTYGVIVQDDTYLSSLSELRSNLQMLRLLLPLLTALMIAIGFFSSYLSTRSRMKEFAVMRCIGMKRWQIFGLLLVEQAVLTALGSAAGFGIGVIVEGIPGRSAFLKPLLMIGAFLVGSALAALRVTSVNVMRLMKTED